MRGADTFTEGLFTLKKLDDFVPGNGNAPNFHRCQK